MTVLLQKDILTFPAVMNKLIVSLLSIKKKLREHFLRVKLSSVCKRVCVCVVKASFLGNQEVDSARVFSCREANSFINRGVRYNATSTISTVCFFYFVSAHTNTQARTLSFTNTLLSHTHTYKN